MTVQDIKDRKEVPWDVQEDCQSLYPVGVNELGSQAEEYDIYEDTRDKWDKPDKELLHGWVSILLDCVLISLQVSDGQHHLEKDNCIDDWKDSVDWIHEDVVYLKDLIYIDDCKDDNACEKDQAKAHRQNSKEDISPLGKVDGVIELLDILLAEIVLI